MLKHLNFTCDFKIGWYIIYQYDLTVLFYKSRSLWNVNIIMRMSQINEIKTWQYIISYVINGLIWICFIFEYIIGWFSYGTRSVGAILNNNSWQNVLHQVCLVYIPYLCGKNRRQTVLWVLSFIKIKFYSDTISK